MSFNILDIKATPQPIATFIIIKPYIFEPNFVVTRRFVPIESKTKVNISSESCSIVPTDPTRFLSNNLDTRVSQAEIISSSKFSNIVINGRSVRVEEPAFRLSYIYNSIFISSIGPGYFNLKLNCFVVCSVITHPLESYPESIVGTDVPEFEIVLSILTTQVRPINLKLRSIEVESMLSEP